MVYTISHVVLEMEQEAGSDVLLWFSNYIPELLGVLAEKIG